MSTCHVSDVCMCVCVCQERAGVKMMMIQDGPMPTGADKPLRISGDPYKVQVTTPTPVPRSEPDLKPETKSGSMRVPLKEDRSNRTS